MPESATPARHSPMLWLLVVLPAVLLLLALGAANWKAFHMAYCKSLLRSASAQKQLRGIRLTGQTHLNRGMSVEETEKLFAPVAVEEAKLRDIWEGDYFLAHPAGWGNGMVLVFQNGRLAYWCVR
jgi:hypothetical protein